MSDPEESTVLGKRSRNGDAEADSNDADSKQPRTEAPMDEDDSDDEQGPMPLPAADGVKKKRKGVSSVPFYHCEASRHTDTVSSSPA
jgi:peptidylprolyl isomerase domain and WD repeat-containing protein 1